MRPEYKETVVEIVSNPKIKNLVYNLLNECIIDEERRKSLHYMEHGTYPQHRDLISKLLYDLDLVEKDRIEKLKNAVVIEGVKNV